MIPLEDAAKMAEKPAPARVAEGHVFFDVDRTSARAPRDAWAVHFTDAPVRNEAERTTTHSLRFPILLVSEWPSDPEGLARAVAAVLNENAHLFSQRAPKPPAPREEA